MASKKRTAQRTPTPETEAVPSGGQLRDTAWQSEEDFATLIENIPDAIFKSCGGRIAWCNNAVQEMFGYTKDELLGTDLDEFFSADTDYSQISERIRHLVEKESLLGTAKTVKKDGSAVYVELSISRLPGKDQPQFVTVAGDITRRKLVEEALQKAKDNLETKVKERTAELASKNEELVNEVKERKLAEEEMRRSEERFRTLIEDSSDAITVLNADGTLRYESPSMARIMGRETGTTIGKTSFELVHPEDLPAVADGMSKLLQNPGGSVQLDIRILHKDGAWRTLEVIARNLLNNPTIEGIVVNQRDITERKKAEDQLRESEEKLKLYLESSPDGLYISDATGTFLYGNRAAEELVGYTRDELIGKSFLELNLLPPEYLPEAARLLELNMAGKPTGPDEFELTRKDGSRIFVEISTYPRGEGDGIEVIGIARDSTERKQMEKALRESEERLRALIENAPESISIYDSVGTIIDCNKKGEELLGYSRDEMVGKNMLDIGVIPQDYVSRTNKALSKNAWDLSGRPFEFELVRKDGSRISVEATTISVERQGKTEVICISRDITQRKQMEQQLYLAGRLAAVGQLAAGVAHELNNPLAAVQGFAQFLAQRSNLDEATKGDLETIYKEAQRATKITGNLLSFARKHTPEKSFISINEALEKSLELHAYRMRVNNVELVSRLDPDLPRTMADFHQIQQVFVNIVTNAEQAMIEVNGKGRLVIKTKKAGEMIRVTFSDDGPGIPGDIMKSVFDPFFTTKDVGKGTGLGLSICYGIVREHGGRLYAREDSRKGATFVVEIPIVSEEQIAAGEVSSTPIVHSTSEQP
jgi:two-component system NtrC family sensor kinase